MAATVNDVLEMLGTLVEPKLKWNILSLNLVRHLQVEQGRLTLEIHLITQDIEETRRFQQECLEKLRPLGFEEIELNLRRVHIAQEGVSGVKQIILVGSGKGGVGKSTVAVNLAAALQQQGQRVGLLDADVYGPSVPTMLGIHQRPEVLSEEYLLPVQAQGLQVISMGMLVPAGKAMAWRGQLVSGTIVQFLQKTLWNQLDYLVVDLPPGTGDVQLTLAQKVKAQGVVIVFTPQEVVLGDVRRALDLYREKEVPILAMVENMSHLLCEKCGHDNTPFVASEQGLAQEAALYIRLPLHRDLSRSSDQGRPLVLESPAHPAAQPFLELAKQVIRQTSAAMLPPLGQGA